MARSDLKLAGNANIMLAMKMLNLKELTTEIFPLFHDSSFFYGLFFKFTPLDQFFHIMV